MDLVFVEFKPIVIAVAVLVGIRPLERIGRSPVAFVRPTVAVAVWASKAILGRSPRCVGTCVGLVGWCGVVAKAVSIGVVPLRSVGWEGIDDAVALIRCVVAVVVLVDVGEPEVDALVVSSVSRDDVGGVGAPCNAVHHTALVVASRGATAGTRSAERVDLCAGIGFIHPSRVAVRLVPVHAGDHLRTVSRERG